MPTFSQYSRDRLATCDEQIQQVANEVVKHFDCRVIWGHRGKTAQNEAFNAGFSSKQWPDSNHNVMPSRAIDVVPYPVDWKDIARFRYFAGHVVGIGKVFGINLRWGGDWDKDTDLKDNKFNDLAHYELINE